MEIWNRQSLTANSTTMLVGILVLLILASSGQGYGEVAGRPITGKLRDMFPYCRIGQDSNGAGVYFAPVAAWKLRDLAASSTPVKEELELHVGDIFEGLIEDSGRNREGATFLVDYAGVDMADVLSPDALRTTIKMFGSNSQFSKGAKRVVFVNSGIPAQFFATIWKPLLGDIMRRTEVYGFKTEEWVPQLLRTVPSHVLPQGYGGTNPLPQQCNREETRRKFQYPTPESVRSALYFVAQNSVQVVTTGVNGLPRALGEGPSAFGNLLG